MAKVLAFGTFDVLHKGHIHFLKKAKERGSLTVVVGRDKTVKEVKGKRPLNNEKKRLNKIKNLNFVDKAVLGNLKDKYKIIEKVRPSIICLGYDQNSFTKNLRKELGKRKIKAKIIRLKAYKKHLYKSSKFNKWKSIC